MQVCSKCTFITKTVFGEHDSGVSCFFSFEQHEWCRPQTIWGPGLIGGVCSFLEKQIGHSWSWQSAFHWPSGVWAGAKEESAVSDKGTGRGCARTC